VTAPFLPTTARASVLGDFIAALKPNIGVVSTPAANSRNVQTMNILMPAMNIDPAPATGGGDVAVVDDSALLPQEGPSGTLADIQKPKNPTISRYVVHAGDSVSSIAGLFGVSANTVRWANNLSSRDTIQPGQVLVILPISGVKYTVQKGDTLDSIARKLGADAADIANYNGVTNADLAVVGTQLLIPDGEAGATDDTVTHVAVASKSSQTSATSKKTSISVSTKRITVNNEPAHNVGPRGTAEQVAYFIAPLAHYVETQGIHGYNAVDLAAPEGTPIVAAASGQVVVARSGGWNGGYGSYVVISHDNGTQTLYAHMSKVTAYDGEDVEQGEVIGYVGMTGLATGPHVHFEIRNGIKNPF